MADEDKKDKPKHSHYEVLTDTWGYDAPDRTAHTRGDILTADEVGPHHKWAVQNKVIAPISAEEARAKRKMQPSDDDEESLDPEDDARTVERKTYDTIMANQAEPDDDMETVERKALNRTRADVRRTQAAEARSDVENLKREV